MESPLSFNLSENFRKKLLSKNLPPYNVDSAFTSLDIPASSEILIKDLSTVDSNTIENIGNQQEGIIFPINQYVPNDNENNYGSLVSINLNLNYKTNEGEYGYSKTIGSDLEVNGNNSELIHIVNNVYKPQTIEGDYGNSVYYINNNNVINTVGSGEYNIIDTFNNQLETIGNTQEEILIVKNKYSPENVEEYGDTKYEINDELILGSNEGEYDISDTVNNQLETIGNTQEGTLITTNKYSPENSNEYGETKYNINDVQILGSNEGEYDISDTFDNQLETIGNAQEGTLITTNKYSPENSDEYGTTKYEINDVQILGSNEGEYDISDTFDNQLETIGNAQEGVLIVKNKYSPENVDEYGETKYEINNELILGSNEGEYDISDTVDNQLETIGNAQEGALIITNKYSPENVDEYGDTKYEINDVQILGSNEGQYDISDTVDNQLETIGNAQEGALIITNKYSPENSDEYGTTKYEINDVQILGSNEGQYDISDTVDNQLETIGNTEQLQSYVKNIYTTGIGNYEIVTIDDISFLTKNVPYANSDSTFSFIPSTYLVATILIDDNPNGSNGSLSQDSNLAGLAVKQLQKEFKHRVALELIQQTLGSINLLDSGLDPDTGGLTLKPNLDPFDALGMLSGDIPIIDKKYNITTPDGLLGKAINFASKLVGLYSPYSYIPDDYFDYPSDLSANVQKNPLSVIGNAISNIFSVRQPANQTSSELFLEYTSKATKKLLFKQLKFNKFRPDYKKGLFSSAPKEKYYIGKDKNSISNEISPPDEISQVGGPVFSYGNIGKLYEGEKLNQTFFGLASTNYYDSQGGIQGGITWMSKEGNKGNNYILPGKFVGFNLNSIAKDSSDFNFTDISPEFDKTKSTNFDFAEGSILDITQKIIDAGNKSKNKLEHVGNAINQISKVFNDGYVEMTKGSRIVRYTTPNSKPDSSLSVVGYEYCRLFTKDRPYMSFDELQKTDGNIRKYTHSILDNTFNLNIAPFNDNNGASSNIVNGKVKKYMFSIENLAWRTSNVPGFTYEDLPACEKGPNGGRVMWFPPYGLSVDESTTTNWNDNNFLGRTEPIYTFNYTKRTGNLSWKIIVDHPSILNLLVDKELENESSNSKITKVIDSFFAGCTKYDLYDLVLKFPNFTPSDIFYTQKVLQDDIGSDNILKELPNENIENIVEDEIVVPPQPTPIPTKNQTISPTPTPTATSSPGDEINLSETFKEVGFYFHNDYPKKLGSDFLLSNVDYETSLNYYKTLNYAVGKTGTEPFGAAKNIIIKYNDLTYADQTATVLALPNISQGAYLSDYIDTRMDSISKFFDFIDSEFDEANKFLAQISKSLDESKIIEFTLLGTASSVFNPEYNKKLSQRRIDSVKQWMLSKKTNNNKTLKSYYDDKKLIINEKSEGEEGKLIDIPYNNINCGKSFENDKNEGTASINAMACRRVKIIDIKNPVTDPNNTPPSNEETTTVEENSDVLTNQTTVETKEPINTSDDSGFIDQKKGSEEVIKTPPPEPKYKTENFVFKDLTKKLARKLLTECNYFEMVRQSDPMIYNGIASKIKNFHPSFHSITPEGLNSRLVFLSQCMRPGSTIPTVSENKNGDQTLLYNDVTNSVFGAPPVCILRVGDFYHTKVVFDQLSFKYEEDILDLNPEGIGVQPMIVNVTMGFNFIGGQGLKEPIAKLQNALSFNYFANTEMYDERAEVTEDVSSKYDAQLLLDEKNRLGIITEVPKRPLVNDGGATIGTILTANYNLSLNFSNGEIEYKTIMNTLLNSTSDYMISIFENLKKTNEELLFGGIMMLVKDRKYTDGYFNYLSGNTTNKANIFGYPEKFQEKIKKLISDSILDVEYDTFPPLNGLYDENFKNKDIKKVKKQIKKLINKKSNIFLESFNDCITTTSKIQLEFIKYIDQINYVANSNDGYLNKKNEPIIFSLTGTSDTNAASVGVSDTFDELVQDFLKIKNKINIFYNKLYQYELIPSGTTNNISNEFEDDFLFNTYSINSVPQQNTRFFILFGYELTKIEGLFASSTTIEEIINNVDEDEKSKWRSFISNNLESAPPFGKSLIYQFNEFKTKKETSFKKFKDEYYTNEINELKTFIRDKSRVLNYGTQRPIFPGNDTNLLDLWSKNGSTWDKFNGRKSFN